MSIKTTIKGFVHKVREPRKGRNNETYYQDVVIRKPARQDEFVEKRGNDDFYPVLVFSKDRSKMHTPNIIGKKVEAECYLHGKESASMEDKELTYYTQLNLKELKFID
jgi:hypothetical protein